MFNEAPKHSKTLTQKHEHDIETTNSVLKNSKITNERVSSNKENWSTEKERNEEALEVNSTEKRTKRKPDLQDCECELTAFTVEDYYKTYQAQRRKHWNQMLDKSGSVQ